MGKLYFGLAKIIARVVYPKPEFIYEEPLPEGEPVVFTANHSGADGPVISTLYFPGPCRPWMIAKILNKKTAAQFVFYDFFVGAVKKHKRFWRFLSRLVASLLRPLLVGAGGIAVYRDRRVIETLNESTEALKSGANIVVFPECPERFTEHINDFYNGFVRLGELYYKETGKQLKFYPTYVVHSLRKVVVGKPIEYDPMLQSTVQRKQIAQELRDRTEELANTLPEHKIPPFLTEEWYNAYGHYWTENRMEDYWNLCESENPMGKKTEAKE